MATWAKREMSVNYRFRRTTRENHLSVNMMKAVCIQPTQTDELDSEEEPDQVGGWR